MGKGRKPLPVSVKAAKGTLQKCRIKSAPEPAEGKIKLPRDYCLMTDTRVSYIFRSLRKLAAEMGHDSPTYMIALSVTAGLLAEVSELATEVKDEGRTLTSETAHGSIETKANPKFKMLMEARRELRAYLIEFGWTPASIQKVGAHVKDKKASGFEGFMDV